MSVETEKPGFAAEAGALAREILGDEGARDGHGLDDGAWAGLTESGLTELLRPADRGGAGASWVEEAAVLLEVGAAAGRVPVVEQEIAGWLLRAADRSDDGTGLRVPGLLVPGAAEAVVPWARAAEQIVLVAPAGPGEWGVWSLARSDVEVKDGDNLAGEPRDVVRLDPAAGEGARVDASVPDGLVRQMLLARSVMAAGAAGTILELVLQHVTTREQFGRPVSRFQAVQHLVAEIAAEASLMRASSLGAADSVARFGLADRRADVAVMLAASCSAHSSATVVRHAHQTLGAMGYTLEHALHLFTNRLLSWRSDVFSPREIDAAVVRELSGSGRDEIWSLFVDTEERN